MMVMWCDFLLPIVVLYDTGIVSLFGNRKSRLFPGSGEHSIPGILSITFNSNPQPVLFLPFLLEIRLVRKSMFSWVNTASVGLPDIVRFFVPTHSLFIPAIPAGNTARSYSRG